MSKSRTKRSVKLLTPYSTQSWGQLIGAMKYGILCGRGLFLAALEAVFSSAAAAVYVNNCRGLILVALEVEGFSSPADGLILVALERSSSAAEAAENTCRGGLILVAMEGFSSAAEATENTADNPISRLTARMISLNRWVGLGGMFFESPLRYAWEKTDEIILPIN